MKSPPSICARRFNATVDKTQHTTLFRSILIVRLVSSYRIVLYLRRSSMGDVSHKRLLRPGSLGAGAFAAPRRLRIPCRGTHHTVRHWAHEVYKLLYSNFLQLSDNLHYGRKYPSSKNLEVLAFTCGKFCLPTLRRYLGCAHVHFLPIHLNNISCVRHHPRKEPNLFLVLNDTTKNCVSR